MQPNMCPCYKCRPKTVSFRDAMRACIRFDTVRNYGQAEADRREREKQARLKELKERKEPAKKAGRGK